jgi:hypothetical protein
MTQPLKPGERVPSYPQKRGLSGPWSWSGCCGEKENLLSVLKVEPWFLSSSLFHCSTVWAVLLPIHHCKNISHVLINLLIVRPLGLILLIRALTGHQTNLSFWVTFFFHAMLCLSQRKVIKTSIQYKHWLFGHYPSSCFYLKQCFGHCNLFALSV